jgi:hypothetical protein
MPPAWQAAEVGLPGPALPGAALQVDAQRQVNVVVDDGNLRR